MTKRIFRSILLVAGAVLLASIVLIMGVLYGYFGGVQERQMEDELTLAVAGVETDGADYLKTVDTDRFRLTWVAADGTVRTAGHAAQIGVYELLAGAAIGQPITAPAEIIGLQVAKTDKGRRAAVGVITGARELLVGTEEQPGLLQRAARMIRSGDFYGNPKSQTCTEKYCPVFHGCRWRR